METVSRKCVAGELLMTEEHVHIFLLAPKHLNEHVWRLDFENGICVAKFTNNNNKRRRRKKRVEHQSESKRVKKTGKHVDFVYGKSSIRTLCWHLFHLIWNHFKKVFWIFDLSKWLWEGTHKKTVQCIHSINEMKEGVYVFRFKCRIYAFNPFIRVIRECGKKREKDLLCIRKYHLLWITIVVSLFFPDEFHTNIVATIKHNKMRIVGKLLGIVHKCSTHAFHKFLATVVKNTISFQSYIQFLPRAMQVRISFCNS